MDQSPEKLLPSGMPYVGTQPKDPNPNGHLNGPRGAVINTNGVIWCEGMETYDAMRPDPYQQDMS